MESCTIAGTAREAKVGGQNRHFMATLDQTSCESAHLYDRATRFLERIIGLYYFQDAHGAIAFTAGNQVKRDHSRVNCFLRGGSTNWGIKGS